MILEAAQGQTGATAPIFIPSLTPMVDGKTLWVNTLGGDPSAKWSPTFECL